MYRIRVETGAPKACNGEKNSGYVGSLLILDVCVFVCVSVLWVTFIPCGGIVAEIIIALTNGDPFEWDA